MCGMYGKWLAGIQNVRLEYKQRIQNQEEAFQDDYQEQFHKHMLLKLLTRFNQLLMILAAVVGKLPLSSSKIFWNRTDDKVLNNI